MKLAADRIKEIAAEAGNPFISATTFETYMRIGAEMVMHEIQMEMLSTPRRSIGIATVMALFDRQKQALDALREKT